MNKELKDYIHYYIGKTCIYDDPYYNNYGLGGVVTEKIIMFVRAPHLSGAVINVKPCLRRLEDITEEEMIAGGWNSKRALQYYLYHNIGAFHSSDFHYLLSKGFDLFGLIDAGLAIDAKNIKPNQQ